MSSIEADAPTDGFLLLADTFYPGRIAELDGKPVSTYRANLSVRAVQLPRGPHTIRFSSGTGIFSEACESHWSTCRSLSSD
jgi:hypothetical protein